MTTPTDLIKTLWSDFNASLKAFNGDGFESPTHRMRCIAEVMDLREELQAAGEAVMTHSELAAITGRY